ncbi:MAG: hypothetical protein M1539_06210 [Actinobacteria bacterium]|nr:hypothetical protein [Actinomycetota bacterium]MCL5883554.1 hypothetical protein [Actinomycetota bacterium]
MVIAIGVIAVVVAFMILVLRGIALVRSAIGFGKTVKMVSAHTRPVISSMMTKVDTAQQHVFSITGNVDRFQRKTPLLMKSIARLMYILKALRDASEKISLSLRKLGY